MAHKTIIWLLLLTIVAVASGAGETQTYVSLKGDFYIEYPDDWAQVDYWLVDAYLLRDKMDTAVLDYEAAFAFKDAPHFFSGDYLILTVDTVGELKDWQIDSVLIELVRSFGRRVRHSPTADYLANPEPNLSNYDTLTKTVTILNEVAEQQILKKSLLMMKFYEQGVATFYFYSPDSLFETSKYLFEQIVASLSTENVEDALPKEQLKVADLEDPEGVHEDENKKSKKIYLYVGAALVLLIVVLIRRLK
jgi:hypothetical protein